MKVLITGAEGFTGQYVSAKLKELGHIVYPLQVNLLDVEGLNATFKNFQPEALVHLAAVSYVNHENVAQIYNTNLIGTYNLLSTVYAHAKDTIKSILIPSSAAIYGNKSILIDEKMPPLLKNDYAVSKFAMEQMSSLWMNKLPIFIVRPFNYTGRGQSENFIIPKIVAHFINKKPTIELGNTHVIREFNDVRFVTEVYCKLLEIKPINKVLNVCTTRGYSISDVIKMCQKITGHQLEVITNPLFIREDEALSLIGKNTNLKLIVKDWEDYYLEDTLKWMLRKN